MKSVEQRLAQVERPSRLSTVQYTAVSAPNTSVAVTSGTFVTVWEFTLSLVVADAVQVLAAVITGAGTTGEIRLLAAQLPGSPTTDVLALPAGAETFSAFDWLVPGLEIGWQGIFIQVQARRVSGANSVSVFLPYGAMQTPSFQIAALANGNPRAL